MLTFILSIVASLLTTGIGVAGAWFYNRKKRTDETTNQIARIINDISAVKDQMANGFEKTTLEIDSVKKEMEHVSKDADLRQKEFYQSLIDRLQAETQKHEDLRTRVDESITETARQMTETVRQISRNTDLVKSAFDMTNKLNDDIRKANNLT